MESVTSKLSDASTIPVMERPFALCFLAIAIKPKMIASGAKNTLEQQQSAMILRIPNTRAAVAKPVFCLGVAVCCGCCGCVVYGFGIWFSSIVKSILSE